MVRVIPLHGAGHSNTWCGSFHFEHDLSGMAWKIKIDVCTASGSTMGERKTYPLILKVVKEIYENVVNHLSSFHTRKDVRDE